MSGQASIPPEVDDYLQQLVLVDRIVGEVCVATEGPAQAAAVVNLAAAVIHRLTAYSDIPPLRLRAGYLQLSGTSYDHVSTMLADGTLHKLPTCQNLLVRQPTKGTTSNV